MLLYQEFKKILASQEKHNHELQRNSRKNLQNYLFLELNKTDGWNQAKQKETTQKKKATSKITALFMESVSPEIQARQLLLNQVMANESVSLKG